MVITNLPILLQYRRSFRQPELQFIMFSKVLLVALLATAAMALEENDSTGYTNCKADGAKLLSVDVEGCEVTPCLLVKGKEYKITVRAQADRVTANLPYSVTAKLFGIDVEILQGEACDFLTQGSCPTTVGNEFTFEKALLVSNTIPDNLTTDIKATVSDDKGDVALCASFKITVSPAAL